VTQFGRAAAVREGVEAWRAAGVKTVILVPSSTRGGLVGKTRHALDRAAQEIEVDEEQLVAPALEQTTREGGGLRGAGASPDPCRHLDHHQLGQHEPGVRMAPNELDGGAVVFVVPHRQGEERFVSAGRFTGSLPGPSVQVMVVVDRLVASRRCDAADQGVGGIAAERKRRILARASEVAVNSLSREEGHRDSPTSCLVSEVAEGGLGKPEIGRHELAHDRITILRYRDAVNGKQRTRATPTADGDGWRRPHDTPGKAAGLRVSCDALDWR